jgi:rare lipoprotein A
MIDASARRQDTADGRAPRHLRLGGALIATGLAFSLANCAEKPSGAQLSAARPAVIETPTTAKKTASRGTDKPYVVAGKTYAPQKDPTGYKTEGLASYYGAGFHGRSTSNGETFDLTSISAAHPTLPLPCYARVTNVANGRSIVVRVNDRGPFHKSRVVDVSQRTAELLDFRRKGTARVKVEYVGPAPAQGGDQERLLATYTDKKATMGETLLAMLPSMPDLPSLPKLPNLLPGHGRSEPAKPADPAPATAVIPPTSPTAVASAAPTPVLASPAETRAASVAKAKPALKPAPLAATQVADATPSAAGSAETPDAQIASRIATGFAGVGTPQPLALNGMIGQPVLGSMGFSAPAFGSAN